MIVVKERVSEAVGRRDLCSEVVDCDYMEE